MNYRKITHLSELYLILCTSNTGEVGEMINDLRKQAFKEGRRIIL